MPSGDPVSEDSLCRERRGADNHQGEAVTYSDGRHAMALPVTGAIVDPPGPMEAAAS